SGCALLPLASACMRFDLELPLAPLRASRQQGDERRARRRRRGRAQRAHRAAAAGEGAPALRARVQVRPAPGRAPAPVEAEAGGAASKAQELPLRRAAATPAARPAPLV